MEPINKDKVFFIPGDVVTVRHKIANKPDMIIEGKKYMIITDKRVSNEPIQILKGMTCYWFDKNERLQRETFSTKDLIHVK